MISETWYYASSRLMLGPAGLADSFEKINQTAIRAAQRARDASGRSDVLVAGSLSHMCPIISGTAEQDQSRAPSGSEMTDAYEELAVLLCNEGCDLILLEMMYYPERIGLACKAAVATGLPVWVGFSARRSEDGQLLSFAPERDIPFSQIVRAIEGFNIAVAGVMHSPSNLISDTIPILRSAFTGPLMAYPDSGFFKMPHWQFENVIPPDRFLQFAIEWAQSGVQIVGGCCGLSPEHIAALKPLKTANFAEHPLEPR